MAVILVEGFDTYNGIGANTGMASKWTVNGSPSLTTGRFSGQCAQSNNSNTSTWSRSLGASYSSFSVGFALRYTAFPGTGNYVCTLDSSGTYQVGITVSSTGTISASRMSSRTAAGAVLGTSASAVIALNTWHYVEIECVISDTVGVFNVYVDGASVLSLSSQDTRNGTPTTVDTISFGGGLNTSNSNGTAQIDDLYVTDSATKLGERRVETLYPTSDVAQGFARSTGATNYTLVDEAQVNGDTDYVQGSSVGDVDTYGLGDLSSTPSAISAVNVVAYAEKTDAASRSIALQVKSGATTSDGSNYALAASYGRFDRLLTTDPNTSAAWTASAVNALQGGPKVTV